MEKAYEHSYVYNLTKSLKNKDQPLIKFEGGLSDLYFLKVNKNFLNFMSTFFKKTFTNKKNLTLNILNNSDHSDLNK
jgi:secreted Zn-dependent insulinase-like peptidase